MFSLVPFIKSYLNIVWEHFDITNNSEISYYIDILICLPIFGYL